MIIADNISKHYPINGVRRFIFENLSLTLNPGDRLGLIGPNGAGKSTLLRLLCGVENPNQGKITRTSTISWPIGIDSGFILTLTGKENIKFACRLFSCNYREQKNKINFVQDFAEIGEYFDMPVNTYSSGMRSRLAFGMSMAFDFDFYVVDEVLATGDHCFSKKCIETFTEKSKDKGIIMVSHDASVIKTYCTQGIYLNQGRLVHSLDIANLIEHYQANIT